MSGSPDRRNELLQRVLEGELAPQQAEEQAKAEGLEPFAFAPEHSAFNPMNEPLWTLPMALAWIMARNAEPVRWLWDKYRRECRDWHSLHWHLPGGPVHEGFELRTREPAGLIDVFVLESSLAEDETLVSSWSDARADLLRRLQSGDLTAHGIQENAHEREMIPPYVWADMDIYESNGRPVVRSRHRGGLDRGYGHVLFNREDVTTRWEAENPGDGDEASIVSSKRPSSVQAVIEVVQQQWPYGLPAGLKAKERNQKIRQLLHKAGASTVSNRTIERALEQLR